MKTLLLRGFLLVVALLVVWVVATIFRVYSYSTLNESSAADVRSRGWPKSVYRQMLMDVHSLGITSKPM